MRPRPTDPTVADLLEAVRRYRGEKERDAILKDARRIGLERAIDANQTEAQTAIEKSESARQSNNRFAWLEAQGEITALFAEHKWLMELYERVARCAEEGA